MNHKTTILYLIAILLPALSCPSLAAPPPNPTASDIFGNTAGGTDVLINNISSSDNTGFGYQALRADTIGSGNSAFGRNSLTMNTTGNSNAAFGVVTLSANTTGSENTAVGHQALSLNLSGNNNTAVGRFTLLRIQESNENLALGHAAGIKLLGGDNNIYLMHPGPAAGVESNTIRVGTNHTRTFIAGIRGKTIGGNAVQVMIDRNGRLGTVVSSARYKKDIQDMNDASHKLLQLRPVTYRYKEPDESGANPIEYGLIAEEVSKVYPDLVAYGADGQIETVQYQKLTPMLLNEVQHMNGLLETEKHKGSILQEQLKNEQLKNQQQAQEIADLKQQAQKMAALEQQVSELQNQSKQIELLTLRLSHIEAQRLVGLIEHANPKPIRHPG